MIDSACPSCVSGEGSEREEGEEQLSGDAEREVDAAAGPIGEEADGGGDAHDDVDDVATDDAVDPDFDDDADDAATDPDSDDAVEDALDSESDVYEANQSQTRREVARMLAKVAKYAVIVVVTAVVFFNVGVYANIRGWPTLFVNTSRTYDGQVPVSEMVLRLNEVAQYLDNDALYSFDIDKATEESISDLLETSGDVHTEFFTQDYYSYYLQYTAGSYSGLGITISQVGKYVMVTGVYEDSPAEKAGVKAGDVVVSIDDKTESWTPEAVTTAIKREKGQKVSIVWLRPTDDSLTKIISAASEDMKNAKESGSDDGSSSAQATAEKITLEGKQVSTTMTYSEVTIPNITSKMIGDIGYIRLDSFNREAGDAVKDAVESLQKQGAKGIILDLRDNGGGYVSQAVDIVSLFVEDGDVLQLRGKNATRTESVNGDKICDLPLVVLVNGNSASASEITTAALKDHERATIVGTTTYGKGTVQNVVALSFGGAIKYTVAEYLSPNGNTINKVGITPDVEVEANEGFVLGKSQDDAQLDKAVQVLESKIGD